MYPSNSQESAVRSLQHMQMNVVIQGSSSHICELPLPLGWPLPAISYHPLWWKHSDICSSAWIFESMSDSILEVFTFPIGLRFPWGVHIRLSAVWSHMRESKLPFLWCLLMTPLPCVGPAPQCMGLVQQLLTSECSLYPHLVSSLIPLKVLVW